MKIVLELAGMEITFFIAARVVLAIVAGGVDNTPVAWLLLNSACTTLQLFLQPVPCPKPVGEGSAGIWEVTLMGHLT